MNYLLLSFSHKNSDISVRERLAFDDATKEKTLQLIVDHPAINEAMILSTCNRVEIFASVSAIRDAAAHLFTLLQKHSGIDGYELEGRADLFEDQGAIHHLFSVISSLDSLVIGETQITGQVKEAFRFAYERGFAAQKIARAMDYALKCAAAVRSLTEITKNPVSIASAAVAMAREVVGNLAGVRAVVVGAGEMGVLAMKHLSAQGANILLVNRSRARAEAAVAEAGIEVSIYGLEALASLLHEVPLVLTATASSEPIITKAMVRPCDFKRTWIDLSVPRNIEEMSVDGVKILFVDDLQDVVSKNLAFREEQARIAYGIVGRQTEEFYRWLEMLSVDPIIKALRARAQQAINKEVARAIDKKYFPAEYAVQLTRTLQAAFNTFLHHPTVRLKEIASSRDADDFIDMFSYLFNLDAPNFISNEDSQQ
ncbi:MAG: glutamyl-tRNA reductase [Campylobacterales bacterium]